MNFIVRYEYALRAYETRSARRKIKHVPLTEQTIGAVFIENDATVDFRCNLKRDAARNVRFDYARDDVRTGSLRRDHKMNAGSARHLRDPRDRSLDICRRGLH